jgi:hypothetical protein
MSVHGARGECVEVEVDEREITSPNDVDPDDQCAARTGGDCLPGSAGGQLCERVAVGCILTERKRATKA